MLRKVVRSKRPGAAAHGWPLRRAEPPQMSSPLFLQGATGSPAALWQLCPIAGATRAVQGAAEQAVGWEGTSGPFLGK